MKHQQEINIGLPGVVRKPGQWLFSLMSHQLYDMFLYRCISRFIWQCDPAKLLEAYQQSCAANHLEIGVGTGYLLAAHQPPLRFERLVLMDLNRVCLAKSARRLADLAPQTRQQDILQPIIHTGDLFDSVAMNYVLHCVPGGFKDKGAAITHVSQVLNPGGIFFGASLVYSGVAHTRFARLLMWVLNRIGVFNNDLDCREQLEECLTREFSEVHIEVCGSAVRWRAVK